MSDAVGGDRAQPAPCEAATLETDAWVEAEDGNVAVFAQYPVDDSGDPRRVVVLCHGLGGDHRGYAQLGSHLAAHGYVVLHPQFLDSRSLLTAGRAAEKVAGDGRVDHSVDETLRTMLFAPEHWVSRVSRVNSVIDSLADQTHLAMSLEEGGVIIVGHSYGAYTAQLVLGTQLFGTGLDQSRFRNPAVAGGVLLSPQGSGDRGLTHDSWRSVDLPILVVTATNDRGPHGEGLAWRREPFDAAHSDLKFLAVARGSAHFLGGVPASKPDESDSDPRVRDSISALVLAFANRVCGDLDAGTWLASGPFPDIF
ncbi:MAG: alpha/beta fold hydrolase, partial [Actinomycetia bacterium]|nr:alpha/beta fold hydrolase [Actinomycetes bacterium]